MSNSHTNISYDAVNTSGAMYIGHVTSPQWTLQACIVSSVNNISVENECSFPVHPSGSCAKACFISGSSKNDIRICRVCVSGGVPSPSQFLAVVFGGKDFPHSYYNQQNLASSSSKGPTVDGRIKPDLVAPGDNILFADSYPIEPRDQKCSSSDSPSQNIYGMSGTSMATPSVSGAAGLFEYIIISDSVGFSILLHCHKRFHILVCCLRSFFDTRLIITFVALRCILLE